MKHAINAVCVYLAHAGEMVKVGVTKDPAARARTLQTSLAVELTMPWIGVFPTRAAAMKAERRIHRMLGPKHVRGEWFDVELEEAMELAETVIWPRRADRNRAVGMPVEEALALADAGRLSARINELVAER